MSSSAAGYVAAGASGCERTHIQVLCLNGEGCQFMVIGSILGHELQQMVLQRLPSKKGSKVRLHHKDAPLLLRQTLQDQGIVGVNATLSCTFVPTDLYAAWRYIRGLPVPEGELALEGVTRMES